MWNKLIPVVAGLTAAICIVAIVVIGLSDLPGVDVLVIALMLVFLGYSVWRNIGDARKEGLLEKVETAEEEIEFTEGLYDGYAWDPTSAPVEQVRAGLPKSRAKRPSTDIQKDSTAD